MDNIALFVALLTLGYLFGRRAERNHFAAIIRREEELRDILAFSERLPPPFREPPEVHFVAGSTVVAIDYFKRVAAGLRGLLGGRVSAYESLLERARREAILRMKLEARALGAHTIVNVKLETASITKGQSGW